MTKRKENPKQKTSADELEQLVKKVQADFENYKKRTQKEKEEFANYANTDLILRLLPVLDNFQLAVKHQPKELADNNWAAGIRHIKAQLEQILAGEGVAKIETEGSQYDPYFHEAVEEVKSDKPKGTIIEEVLRGYKLDDKIIRHSKVKVSKGNK